MKIFIPLEDSTGEGHVPLLPSDVERLVKKALRLKLKAVWAKFPITRMNSIRKRAPLSLGTAQPDFPGRRWFSEDTNPRPTKSAG